MLFQKKVIVLFVAQSAALLASGFVAPNPFGLSTTTKSFSNGGPLLVSAVEDEAAEAVVEDVEPVMESLEAAEPEADAKSSAPQKQRLTIFVGNLPFRTWTNVCVYVFVCFFPTYSYLFLDRNDGQ